MELIRERVPWTREEEDKLRDYVNLHGPHHWDTMARYLDMGRSGNSCRLKWVHHLKPGIKRGEFTDQEILAILKLRFDGKGWSRIAEELPGRTDNQIKNFWNSTRLKKEAKQLNCEVKSEEFLDKMTAKLTDRIQAAASLTNAPDHATYSTGGSGVTTDTLEGSSRAVESANWSAQEFDQHHNFDDESIWDNLVSICDDFPMVL